MLLNRFVKKSLGLQVGIEFLICSFICVQIGCIQPPEVTVVQPTSGFTDEQNQSVSLNFTAGTAPINIASFTALQNDSDVSSLFNVNGQGATGSISLIDGANMLDFSVHGTDGGEGSAFACVYKNGSEEPQLSGEIGVLTSSQFDTQIYASMNAPNALANYAASYGVPAHSFSQSIHAEIQAGGHDFQVYLATLASPETGSLAIAANPNEKVEFVQVILPLSITHGTSPRDYTFLLIQNRIDKYVIIDNGEGGSFRIDYTDPDDSDTYTVQWYWNGVPVDPPGGVFAMAGLSTGCWMAIGGALFSTIGAAALIGATGFGGFWMGYWLMGKALSTYSLWSACGCDMGTYPRC
jgi:hypothetical protein